MRQRRSLPRRLLVSASVAAFAIGVSACGSNDSGGGSGNGPIKIGVDVSLTGPVAFAGVQEAGGMKLAAKVINDAGGVLGRQVELVALDDASAPDQTVLNIRKLVQQEEVVAVAGPGSSNATVVAAQTAEQLQVPLLALPSTTGDIWEGAKTAKWAFGIAGNGTALGNGCITSSIEAEKAKGNTIKSIALGYEDNPGALAYVAGVKNYAAKNNITITDTVQWEGNVTDLTNQVNKLVGSKPDMLVVSALQASDALAIKAADQLGVLGSLPFANCSSLNAPTLFQALGPATATKQSFYLMSLAGDVYPSIKTGTPNDKTRQAAYDAQVKYGNEVSGVDGLTNFGYAGWDVVNVLTDAMKKAGSTDGAKVRDALETTDMDGGQATVKYGPQQHRATYDDFRGAVLAVVFNQDGSLKQP